MNHLFTLAGRRYYAPTPTQRAELQLALAMMRYRLCYLRAARVIGGLEATGGAS